jgi:hypothetical protein
MGGSMCSYNDKDEFTLNLTSNIRSGDRKGSVLFSPILLQAMMRKYLVRKRCELRVHEGLTAQSLSVYKKLGPYDPKADVTSPI